MKPRILSTARLSFPLATALAALLAVQAASATNLYWDVNGTTAGFSTVVGAWNGTNNFWNTSSTGGAGTVSNTPTSADDLFISQATTNTGTITISGATKNASSITFAANAGPTVTISGGIINIGGTGTFSGIFGASSGANTISSALQLNSGNTAFNFSNSGAGLLTIGAVTGTATTGNVTQTITVGSSSSGGITLNGIIADVSGSATKVALNVNNTSTGNTTLSGANTFTGGVTLTAGRLFANTSASALGAGALTLNGGTLDFNGGAAIAFNRNTTVGGNVTIISQRSAANPGVNYTLGTLSIGTNTLTAQSGNSTGTTAGLTFGATTLTGSPTFNVGNSTVLTMTLGAITGGANGFTKSGTGTLLLSAANTYSGPTIINAGTLRLDSATALGSTSAITLGSTTAATLSTSVDGITIAAPITLGNTGITSTLAFGLASAATGNITLNGAIGGAGNLTFTTPNAVSGGNVQTTLLGAASNYAGSTSLTTGNVNNTVTLKNGVINALPVTTVLTLNGGAGTGSGGRTITYDLAGFDQTLAGLTNTTGLASRNQRVTSSTAATLTVNNNADFTYGGTFTDAGNSNLVTTSTITGAIALTKSGIGTLTLNGAVNSFTGNVNVTGGTLVAGVAGNNTNSSLGSAVNTRTVTVSTGGTLRFDVGNVFNTNFSDNTTTPSLAITGGTVTNGGSASNNALGNITLAGGTLTATTGHATYGAFNINGTITSTGTSTISSTGGFKMILNSSGANNVDTASIVDVQSGTLTVSAPLADLFAAETKISGLSKTGAGVLTLSGTGTYTGATSVTAGTLTLSGSGSINGSSGITLNGSGTKILQTSSVAASPALTLTQGTLTGSGTVDTVNVGDGTGGIISNNNGVSGAALTIGNLTLAGAANLNLFSSTIAADLIVTGALTTAATPATITANNVGGWTNGNTYTLLTYGSIAGSGNNFTQVVNNLSARQVPTWADTGTAITLAIAGDSPYWFGNGDGKWNLASANNWKLISNNNDTVFLAGDDVLFDDNATGAGAISVDIDVADVATNNTIFSNDTRDYTLSGAFGISAGTLTKSGNANLTISAPNTYTGATTLNAGTITLSGSGTLGSGSAVTLNGGKLDLGTTSITVGAVSVTAPAASGDTIGNGSLTGTSFAVSNTTGNVILSANLLGAGALTKSGAGTLTPSGTNAYTGSTTIGGGILIANSTAALGDGTNAGNTLIFAGGTLQASGTITSPSTRTVTLTSTGLIDTNGNAVSIAGTMSGAGGLTKSGAGTLTLTGASNYTGATTIGVGTLNANSTAALGNGSATNTLIFTGGTLQAGGTITSPATRLVSLTSTGVIDTNGNNVSFAGVASGAGLTKNGLGTLTFSAFNTFTGPITINGGTLEFSASGSSTNVYLSTQININNGSTLRISGGTSNVPIYDGRTYTFDANGGGSILVGAGNYNAATAAFTIATLGGARDTIGLITTSTAFGFNLGSVGGTFDVALGSDATSDLTVTPNIANTGPILKTGTGRLTLTGSNTYSGTTTIGAGTLNANSTAALGNASATNTLIFTGGTLQAGGAITSAAARTVTLTSTGVIDTNNFAVSIAGIASGAGGLTKIGAGTLTLSGVNTYTGATSINAGTLSINTIAGVGAASSAIGAPTTVPNGLIAMGQAATTGTLIYTGAAQSTDRTIQIGTNSTTPAGTDTGGATIEANGASNAALTFSSAIFNTQTDASTGVGANRTLTLQGTSTGTNTISGTIQDNLVSGAGTGTATVGVTKAGAGTWILAGTNTYTGQTTVTGTATSELRITSATALDGTSGILVSSGRLALAGGITIGSGKTITINGSGNNLGALTNNSGNNEWAGNVTIGSASTRIGNIGTAPGDLKISGVIDSGANVYGIIFRTGIAGTSITLSGANTYLGDTTLGTNTPTGGSLILSGGANRLPTTTKLIMGFTTVSGVLDLNGQNQEVAGISVGQASGTFTNEIKSTAAATFTVNTASASSYSGLITGGISLVKTGTDTLTLSGANTYIGGTTVNQGTLTIGTGGTLGATTGALAVNNTNNTAAGTAAVLNLATAVDTTTGSLSGTIATPTSGTNTASINNGGSGRNFTVNQTAAGSYAGVIAGDGSFTLGSLSTNTLTLTATNTYTGGTTVSAGKLLLSNNSAAGTGDIAVSGASAILEISAANTLANNITVSNATASVVHDVAASGTYTTGTSGNLTSSFAGGQADTTAQILGGTSSVAATLEMLFAGTSAATNDGIRRSDVFTTAGTSTDTYVIQLSTGALAADSVLAWLNGSNEWVHAGTTFYNETYTFAARVVGDYGYDSGNVWAVVDHGGAFTAVPEPTSALAGLLIAAGLLRRRRSA